MYAFSFFRTKPGIEPGHPRTWYPEDVIHNTIGHVGSTIYVVNEVLFIYHSLLTLHIYVINKIYTIYITYKIYNTNIRCIFSFFRTQPGIEPGHSLTYQLKHNNVNELYCGTHVTDGVTDDIFWIQGTRKPWFNTRLGPEKRKIAHILYIHFISDM